MSYRGDRGRRWRVCWPLHHRERWVKEVKKQEEKGERRQKNRAKCGGGGGRGRTASLEREGSGAHPRATLSHRHYEWSWWKSSCSAQTSPPGGVEDAVENISSSITTATVFVVLDAESFMSSNLQLSSGHPADYHPPQPQDNLRDSVCPPARLAACHEHANMLNCYTANMLTGYPVTVLPYQTANMLQVFLCGN